MLYKIYGCGLRDEFGRKDEKSNYMEKTNCCFVTADMTSITQAGDLLFLTEDKKLILALAACEWRSVYECGDDYVITMGNPSEIMMEK